MLPSPPRCQIETPSASHARKRSSRPRIERWRLPSPSSVQAARPCGRTRSCGAPLHLALTEPTTLNAPGQLDAHDSYGQVRAADKSRWRLLRRELGEATSSKLTGKVELL